MSGLETLGWVLLHSLWQGALIAGTFAAALLLLRESRPNTRYLLGILCLSLLLLVPLATWGLMTSPASAPVRSEQSTAALAGPSRTSPLLLAPSVVRAGRSLRDLLQPLLPWFSIAWMVGICLLSLRLAGGSMRLATLRRKGVRPAEEIWQGRLQRLANRLRLRKPVRLLESSLARVPMLMGGLRPVILVPTAALVGLPVEQVEAILAHELAHVRRHDFVVNLLQSLVEILLFYHPAAWWISSRLRWERELCCDDAGVAVCGGALVYARALLAVEELRNREPRLAMAASGASLQDRILRLFEKSGSRARPSSLVPGLASALALIAILTCGALIGAQFPGGTHLPAPPSDAGIRTPRVAGQHSKKGSRLQQEIERFVKLGLDRAWLRSLAADPSRVVPLSEVRRWEVHGVKQGLVAQLQILGLERISVDQLLNLIWFQVDGAFVRDLREIGYARLTADQLISLGRYGVNAAFVEGYRRAGYDFHLDDLILLGRYQAGPAYVEALSGVGLSGLSPRQIAMLRRYGVQPDFIRAFHDRGYGSLTVRQILMLQRYEVRPGDVEAARRAGFDHPSPDRLIELRRYGSIDSPGPPSNR